MRTYLVEVPPPCFDQNLRLGARTKPFEAQTLVAELAVEALRRTILPGLAWIDQCGGDALVDDNEARTHRTLNKDAPIHRLAQSVGAIIARPILGGLHHQYSRI